MKEAILIEKNKALENDVRLLQERINKAIEYINEICLSSDGYCDYGDDLNPEHIIDLLKGE